MRTLICSAIVWFVMSSSFALETLRPTHTEAFAEKISWQQRQEPAEFSKFRGEMLAAFSAQDAMAIPKIVSTEMGNRERTAEFLSFLKQDHGAITHLQFKYFDTKKQRNNPTLLAVYHCVFSDNSWWDLRIGLDKSGLINRFIITDPNYNEALPRLTSKSELELPFLAGEKWFVLWEGLSEEANYHVTSRAQRNALVLLVRHPFSQQSYQGSGKVNEDYFAYGRSVLAHVNGVVVEVIDGVADNLPGEMNSGQLTGNTIVIRTDTDEYLLLAHLKNSSITVAVGEAVAAGQPLAQVGNSGNSSEPHLHMHMMTTPTMKDAMGIEMRYKRLAVNRAAIALNYSPINGDVIARTATGTTPAVSAEN